MIYFGEFYFNGILGYLYHFAVFFNFKHRFKNGSLNNINKRMISYIMGTFPEIYQFSNYNLLKM